MKDFNPSPVMDDFQFEDGSDQEVSENHSKLIDAVTQLDKGQRVRKAERSEPSLEVSEFHLVKSGVSHGNTVHLRDLAETLGKRATHAEIGKKLRVTQKKSKTLQKPLEKPAAARIKRAIGFENVKKDLGKWDAIVTKNRTAEHLSFPLEQSALRQENSSEFLKRFQVQSELEIALAEIEPVNETKSDEQENTKPMNLEQIIERRNNAARFRAQQSYKEAKAHRQNKIKSKKFHRIERKQKIKQQLKDFEVLQKTDPEAALEKLELLEKSRAEERMSLRHKSTGQWAKNQQVRAKYDKESRQVLAQQLSISRELTQKLQNDEDDEDDNEDEESIAQTLSKNDKENPWTNNVKNQSEIDEFISGYRKYWDAKNEQEKSKENKECPDKNSVAPITQENISNTFNVPKIKDLPLTLNPVEEVIVEHSELMFTDDSDHADNKDKQDEAKPMKKSRVKQKSKKNIDSNSTTSPTKKRKQASENKKLDKTKKRIVAAGTSEWLVTPYSENAVSTDESGLEKYTEIDDIFDTITVKSSEKFNAKLKNIKNNINQHVDKKDMEKQFQGTPNSSSEYVADLSFKNPKQRPLIDEELVEAMGKSHVDTREDITQLRKLANSDTRLGVKPSEAEIDPNKFINIKPKHLQTQLPDIVTAGDDGLDDSEGDEDKHNLISEAFADDDVVDEFKREKDNEIKKSQPESVDLSLPGWGSWGGKNVEVSGRKKRRFILKFPKDAPRKDQNKGDVIIIEEKNSKLKEHQVSELPFPFNSVKDFEASVRAPIGRTFIPENAHRRLIEPTIKTKMGKIIEPMDENSLVNTKKMDNHKQKALPHKEPKKNK